MSLCVSFQEMSKWTWSQLERSFRLNAPFNEETITETILLELKDRHPTDIAIVSFSKIQEKRLGADWEFWFTDKNGQRGIGWRVQAKRLYRPAEEYSALKPSETASSSQIQTLISQAQSQGLVPIYCFYNSVSDPNDVAQGWACRSFSANKWLFGCSIAHAVDVHNLGKRDFKAVSQISMPWHCAVCCQGFSRPESDLPQRVAGVSRNLPNFGRDTDATADLSTDLPEYVKLLAQESVFRGDISGSEIDFEETLYGLSEGESKQLRGVAVFKHTEADE
ncbi:hypothetical protein LOM8899_01385 [Flavimaricola marinus]|uniref:Uncharacterized protein n=1 Tax=Flavimaricola marinus TaxID=1819565 RepID=A0A238LCE4_9RHOB|nr:hypothetical protein LOM8899_01385 [Flavimaricola marinus]